MSASSERSISSISPRVLHISGYGKHLMADNGLMRLDCPGDGERVHISPVNLEQVIVSGNHMLTTGAIGLIVENGADIVCLDSFGNPVSYTIGRSGSRIVSTWNAQLSMSKERAMDIARAMCKSAALNKALVLQSIEKSRKLNLSESIVNIRSLVNKMEFAESNSVLMGYEGAVTNEYLGAISNFMPIRYGFCGRVRHPPTDPINSLLSYGYGILYARIRRALTLSNLNPYKGVLHSSYKAQEALVYDLIEEFRQPVVDKMVLTLAGRKQIPLSDFTIDEKGFCIIGANFKRVYANYILEHLDSPVAGNENYQDIIENQAKKLRDSIIDGIAYIPYRMK